MPSWKIALSLALLAGAAQLAAAQTPAQRAADKLNGGQIPLEDRSKVPGGLVRMGPPVTIVPGKWDIKYHWKGTTTDIWTFDDGYIWNRPVTWDNGPLTWDNLTVKLSDGGMPALPPAGDPNPYKGNPGAKCTGVSRDITATVTVLCAWVAADPNALTTLGSRLSDPPKTLNLLEQSNAYAYDGDFASGAAADNGMGDPALWYQDDYNAKLASGSGGYAPFYKAHLTLHQVTDGQVIFSHSLHAATKVAPVIANGGASGVSLYIIQSSQIGVFYKAVEDTRSAMITCFDIETPANWHIFNEDSGGPLPTDAPNLNVRDGDGAMSVDTVVAPGADIHSWTFKAHLITETTGFDMTPNFYDAYLTNTSVLWTANVYTTDAAQSEIDIFASGKNSDIRTSPFLIRAHVNLEDRRPNMEATADNKYTIRVHSPLENAREILSKRVFDHDEEFPWSEQVGAGANDATVSLKIQSVPSWVRDDATETGLWISGVAGSGAAALIPTFPEGTPAIIADMVCNAVGIELIKFGMPDPAANTTAKADFAAFSQAVADEMQIVNGAATDANMVCRSEHRVLFDKRWDPKFADDPKLLYQYWLSSVNPLAKCHAGVRMQRCTVEGDQYNVNGYAGYHQDTTLAKGPSFLVWEFKLSSDANTGL